MVKAEFNRWNLKRAERRKNLLTDLFINLDIHRILSKYSSVTQGEQ